MVTVIAMVRMSTAHTGGGLEIIGIVDTPEL
jgi:hypothetical protein